jgi:hypothetical protein
MTEPPWYPEQQPEGRPGAPRQCWDLVTPERGDGQIVVASYLTREDALLASRSANAHTALVAACEAFSEAMRAGDTPCLLRLIEALGLADHALRLAREACG